MVLQNKPDGQYMVLEIGGECCIGVAIVGVSRLES